MKCKSNHDPAGSHGNRTHRVAVEEADEPDWNVIHAEIQRQLAGLDEGVQARVPGVQIDPGRTSGRSFLLFSYRRFAPPRPSRIDPVVAGLTFKPLDGRIAIEADISGEECGDILRTCHTSVVSSTSAPLLQQVREIALCLASAADQIAAALVDAERETQ